MRFQSSLNIRASIAPTRRFDPLMQPHQRIFFIQFAVAFMLGALFSRLPDLQARFALSEGQLGILLVSMSSGVLFGLTFSVPVIERFGARTMAFLTVFGASTGFALVPWMPSAVAAAPVLFVAGILTGAFEINANIETDRHEARLGRRIMSRAHGMWSTGFFITALVGAIMRQATIPVEIHMALALALILISGTIIFTQIQTAPRRDNTPKIGKHLIALPTLGLLPLCLIGAAPLLAEGASVDWSAIYMRDVFAASPFVGGLGVTIFSLMIAIGRLVMDKFVDRFDALAVARSLLLITAAGLVMVATAPHAVVALAGFALTGIGCSAVYPLAISAAAGRGDRAPSVNVAALGQTTFLVFFAGPPLLGFVAEYFGVRCSYWTVVPLVAAALISSRALAKTRVPVA